MNRHQPIVSVCGSSGIIGSELFDMASTVGRGLAEAGINVLCGGRDGVMEAVCHGVSLAQGVGRGLSIALLPGETHEQANAYADLVIPSGIGYARNAMVALGGEVVLVIAGATGTLSEAAYAWNYGKPVLALIPSGGVAAQIAGQCMDGRFGDPVAGCSSPLDMVNRTAEILRERGRLPRL